ncbi:F/Y rich C-terminus-domain-containing protein [Choanephora cucurbitarum]|nr:F/Y rich C-terminus-domain-containing protein [Choanephora cucurbitarum]
MLNRKQKRANHQDEVQQLKQDNQRLRKELKQAKLKLILMSKEKDVLMDKVLMLTKDTPPPPSFSNLQPIDLPKTPCALKDCIPYLLPCKIGIFTIYSLGKINPNYHSALTIYPVGYKVSRSYYSMANPFIDTTYTCTIEENGATGPLFEIVAEDCPNKPIIGSSANEVWRWVIYYSHLIRKEPIPIQVNGSEFYGLTHPTIMQMIQGLPYANQCQDYLWQPSDQDKPYAFCSPPPLPGPFSFPPKPEPVYPVEGTKELFPIHSDVSYPSLLLHPF